jgi:hypothetical protein
MSCTNEFLEHMGKAIAAQREWVKLSQMLAWAEDYEAHASGKHYLKGKKQHSVIMLV